MLTVEQIDGLVKGDVVETYPLFEGMSDVPVILRVMKVLKQDNYIAVDFTCMWQGITLGIWDVRVRKGKIKWTT